MKNTIYISHLGALDDQGFFAQSIADKLSKDETSIIISVPNYNIANIVDRSNYTTNDTKIDTIIQYLDIDLIEYHNKYKNIVIFHERQFYKRKPSKIQKLLMADEIWVFDDQNREFLCEYGYDRKKITNIGIPYSHNRIHVDTEAVTNNHLYTGYYTVIDFMNLENLERLIFNFVLIFNTISNIRLTVFFKNFYNDSEEIVKIKNALMDRIKSHLCNIDSNIIEDRINFVIGNPYDDMDQYIDVHKNNVCYINIENVINVDVITAFRLNKHIISICDIGNVLLFNKEYIIETVPSNFRLTIPGSEFVNEQNMYPMILDSSIQELLLKTSKNIKENNRPYIKKINKEGFYDSNF